MHYNHCHRATAIKYIIIIIFLLYFVNRYMFRAYLGPPSGGTTVCIQLRLACSRTQLCHTTDSHLKRIISTQCCIHAVVPSDDGLRCARNVQRLTEYAKDKLCIKLVFLYTTHCDILIVKNALVKVRATSRRSAQFGVSFNFRLM